MEYILGRCHRLPGLAVYSLLERSFNDDPVTTVSLKEMSFSHHPASTSSSNIASATGTHDPAFPTIYRRDKTSPAIDVQSSRNGDGIDSFVSMPVGGETLPQREKHHGDKLAPMPENRRLGYLSVAALIINKMIGTSFKDGVLLG